jgi:hypothetical protein
MILLALAALGASACGKKDEPKPTPTAGSAAAGSAAAGSAAAGSAGEGSAAAGSAAAGSAAPATAEVDVPTEVDFETDAAAKIDEKNVEAQLKTIEQELAR